MTTVVHKLYNVDHVAKLNFVNQYLQETKQQLIEYDEGTETFKNKW